MSPSVKVICGALLLVQLASYGVAQRQSAQAAEDQNQKPYYDYSLNRAFQPNRAAPQQTPVTEEESKEQQFFNKGSAPSAQQLQEQQNALLAQYLAQQAAARQQQYPQFDSAARQQQYPQFDSAARQQQYPQFDSAARQQQYPQYDAANVQQPYKAAEQQYPTLLGVRFSAAPSVAKTQFSGNGFSFSY